MCLEGEHRLSEGRVRPLSRVGRRHSRRSPSCPIEAQECVISKREEEASVSACEDRSESLMRSSARENRRNDGRDVQIGKRNTSAAVFPRLVCSCARAACLVRCSCFMKGHCISVSLIERLLNADSMSSSSLEVQG